MASKAFLGSNAHRNAVKSLYHHLIRGSRKLKDTRIPLTAFDGNNKSLSKERDKYNYDPSSYAKCISYEIYYHIKEAFLEVNNRKLSPNILLDKMTKGIELTSFLKGALSGKHTDWNRILLLLIDYRRDKFYRQEWKAEYKQDEEAFDKYIFKDNQMALSKKKDKIARMNQKNNKYKGGLIKRIKNELKESTSNSAYIVRRFLKNSQLNQKLPVPNLLPYTVTGAKIPEHASTKLSLTVPGSTKSLAIEEAYDLDIIEGIIKPSIEYDINKYHYVDNLKTIVQEKGPFKVQINITEAGPTSIPFIRLPYPRLNKMRDVALDIKYLMRRIRLKTVWNSQPGDNSLSEPKFADGSFSVRGSKGFTKDERIHPRYYYEDLAINEGIWESMIAQLEGKNNVNVDEIVNSYLVCLDVSSKVLDDNVNHYFQKYKALRSPRSPLIKEQRELQQSMNHHYDEQLNKYKKLIEALRDKNIVKHSEIINTDFQMKTYGSYLEKEDSKFITKLKKGIPELERRGMGKKLGDYLDDFNYHNFKLGEKFGKRFKF